jgi:hypothetical protein
MNVYAPSIPKTDPLVYANAQFIFKFESTNFLDVLLLYFTVIVIYCHVFV